MRRLGIAVAALFLLTLPAQAGVPQVTRRTLSNGVRVQISEQHEVPALIVDVLVDAGARLDPKGKEGLASLVADLLTEGAGQRGAQQISDTVDFIGARFSSSADMDYASLGLTVLRKDLDVGLGLLADSLLRPSFPAKEIERRRDAILARIKAEEDQPGRVAGKAFRRALFGDEPYGHPVEGWPESVARLSAADIRQFYRAWYRPDRTIITVVGDIDADAAIAELEQRLKGWAGESAASFVYPPFHAASAGTVVIDKPTSQANIVLGQRGVARDNPDFYALTVMNYILGGGTFSSRLFDTIRTKAGLAYSVTSLFTVNKDPGSFQVVMQTKSSSAREAIAKAREEIERIRNEPVSDNELRDAKKYLTGSFPLRFDTNLEIADFFSQVALYGLGDDYATTYADRISAVSEADVQRVAKQYLHPQDLILVVVGNSSETGIRNSK